METIFESITAEDIMLKALHNEDVILMDTLAKESFCSVRIPGSINLPTSEIKAYAEHVLPDKEQNIIVYCKDSKCNRSMEALRILQEMGYKNVQRYPHGLKGWEEEGFQLVKTGKEINEEC